MYLFQLTLCFEICLKTKSMKNLQLFCAKNNCSKLSFRLYVQLPNKSDLRGKIRILYNLNLKRMIYSLFSRNIYRNMTKNLVSLICGPS